MRNLLLGAKIIILATLTLAFVACDKDDDDEDPVTYGMSVYKDGTMTYFDADANFSYDQTAQTLTITDIMFDSAMPGTLTIDFTGIVEGQEIATPDFEAEMTMTNGGAVIPATSSASISSIEVDVEGSLIDVEFDCTYGGTTYEVEYYGENR